MEISERVKYITRNGGATVTVFVPYDCENHCPFCINKQEYADTSSFNLEEIIKSIKIMSVMNPECDFVFTGGEPVADLNTLGKMIYAVHVNVDAGWEPFTHKVFINTTLPTNKYSEDELAKWLNTMYEAKMITGINVSRHLRTYVQESSDKIFKKLKFEPRINCVLYNIHLADVNIKQKLIDFVNRFRKITGYIQFRKDYVVTTPENLYDEENDGILNLLKDTFDYRGSFGRYRMRVGYEFDYKRYKITYHKTLPYSKIKLDDNNTYVLYDIIIKQNGEIRDDWDVTLQGDRTTLIKADELDLTAYRNVKYEEYV